MSLLTGVSDLAAAGSGNAAIWRETFAHEKQNAEIAASGTEDFGIDQPSQESRKKYGSMNKLLLVNRSGKNIQIHLDGDLYAELFTNAGITINPEDGKFFDFIRVTNLDAGAVIAASTVTVRYARADLRRV